MVRGGGVSGRPRPPVRKARAARHEPDGVRMRGRGRRELRPGLHGARSRRHRTAQLRLRAGVTRDVRAVALRVARTEGGLAADDGSRGGDRLLRPHRARPRQRSQRHADDGSAYVTGLGPRRHQDVDHQRRPGRRRRRMGTHRRGCARVRGTSGHPRLRHERHARQALPACFGDVGAGVHRLSTPA